SRSVQSRPERLTIQGELELAGASKPTTYQLAVSADARASGTLSITQSAWGIKPYRAFMGALKVKDQVEIVLDVALPSS
ncbi:MAG: YceI family protein, partial [Solirubrobacterales bacterium]|nr:YceI family protein [Solirubrobacterales bacterium]